MYSWYRITPVLEYTSLLLLLKTRKPPPGKERPSTFTTMDELPVGRGDRATERLSLIVGVLYEL